MHFVLFCETTLVESFEDIDIFWNSIKIALV